MQDLAAGSDVSTLISPVAHLERNPIEMVMWGTVKILLKRANLSFYLATLRSMAELEFQKITLEVWARYEDESENAEIYFRAIDGVCAEGEAAFYDGKVEDETELVMSGDSVMGLRLGMAKRRRPWPGTHGNA